MMEKKSYVKPEILQLYLDCDLLAQKKPGGSGSASSCKSTMMAVSGKESDFFKYNGGTTLYIVDTRSGGGGTHYTYTLPCTGDIYLKFSNSGGEWDMCSENTGQCEYNYNGFTEVTYKCGIDGKATPLNYTLEE